MSRNTKVNVRYRVFAIILFVLFYGFALRTVKAADTTTNFNYPDVNTGTTEFEFYEGPSQTDKLEKIIGGKIKNVIFLIGDGMGMGQVTTARVATVGLDNMLWMEKMPATGITYTHSANAAVTDSAAAGTALATGLKTNNGMICTSPDKSKKYQTILNCCKNKGMATGLVVTSRITHATPACFASHVESRGMEAEIAEQLLTNKVNVLLGGGKDFFLPKSIEGSKRTDDLNLIEQAKKDGYNCIETSEELTSAKGPYLLGLFQMAALKTTGPEPSLVKMTKKAIEILSKNKKGFFMMVEGSQIDWACHGNNINNSIRQTLLFDEAVKAAIDFAISDKHTLVIVTADHETGGLVLNGINSKTREMTVHWSTKGHSGLPVPIYAYGPGDGAFAGVYDNTEVSRKIAALLKIRNFPSARK